MRRGLRAAALILAMTMLCGCGGRVAAADDAAVSLFAVNVGKGDALIKVSPADSFQVEFEVPESDLFSLQEGQSVKLELYWDNENGGVYDGKIAAISYKNETTATSSDRKTYKVWASFTPDERIRLGMTMVVYPVAASETVPENTTDEE